jgi:crossover junction endodeoxyribonuclease RuvC
MKQKRATVVLGIDPGVRKVGYGVVRQWSDSLECLGFGIFRPGPEKYLQQIEKYTKRLIKEFDPQIIAIEKVFFSRNASSAMALSEVRGVLLLQGEKANRATIEVTPLQVKQRVCGHGFASKDVVGKTVSKLLALKEMPEPPDITDALAIALAASLTPNAKDFPS